MYVCVYKKTSVHNCRIITLHPPENARKVGKYNGLEVAVLQTPTPCACANHAAAAAATDDDDDDDDDDEDVDE